MEIKNVTVNVDGELWVCHGPEVPLPTKPEIKIFSQRDPLWVGHSMGGIGQTIGSAGCALVCAAMVASQVMPNINPAWLNAKNPYNIVNIGLGPEAHLAWETLPDILPNTTWVAADKLTWKQRLTQDQLDMVIAKLAVAPLILYVDFYPGGAFSSHFVLGLRYLEDIQDIEIADPWDGSKTKLLQRYARPGQDLKTAIWGIRGYYANV